LPNLRQLLPPAKLQAKVNGDFLQLFDGKGQPILNNGQPVNIHKDSIRVSSALGRTINAQQPWNKDQANYHLNVAKFVQEARKLKDGNVQKIIDNLAPKRIG